MISNQLQRKLKATEIWFLRRTLRTSRSAKKSNEAVLREADTTRSLISRKH